MAIGGELPGSPIFAAGAGPVPSWAVPALDLRWFCSPGVVLWRPVGVRASLPRPSLSWRPLSNNTAACLATEVSRAATLLRYGVANPLSPTTMKELLGVNSD